jgi:hypothetical protein
MCFKKLSRENDVLIRPGCHGIKQPLVIWNICFRRGDGWEGV